MLVLVRPSTDGMRPSHTKEGICFAQSTDPNVNLTQNSLTDTPRALFDSVSEHPVTQSVDTQS